MASKSDDTKKTNAKAATVTEQVSVTVAALAFVFFVSSDFEAIVLTGLVL